MPGAFGQSGQRGGPGGQRGGGGGQRGGGRPGGGRGRPGGGRPREKREFDHKLVDLSRVTRVVAGGRRFKFRATVVIGNRKGRVGMGIAKGKDVSKAVDKAQAQAKKVMVDVPIINGTIPHQVQVKFGGAEVLLKPARPGTGIIAGGSVRPVVELAGIKDVISKMLGSSNHANNVQATLEAFRMLSTPDMLEARRQVKVRGTFQRNEPKAVPVAAVTSEAGTPSAAGKPAVGKAS